MISTGDGFTDSINIYLLKQTYSKHLTKKVGFTNATGPTFKRKVGFTH